MEMSEIILRIWKTDIENVIVNNLAPGFYEMLGKKNATENEINWAGCMLDDILNLSS